MCALFHYNNMIDFFALSVKLSKSLQFLDLSYNQFQYLPNICNREHERYRIDIS